MSTIEVLTGNSAICFGEKIEYSLPWPKRPLAPVPHDQMEPLLKIARLWAAPQATFLTCLFSGKVTSFGIGTAVQADPIPICPQVFPPQQYNFPSFVMAAE